MKGQLHKYALKTEYGAHAWSRIVAGAGPSSTSAHDRIEPGGLEARRSGGAIFSWSLRIATGGDGCRSMICRTVTAVVSQSPTRWCSRTGPSRTGCRSGASPYSTDIDQHGYRAHHPLGRLPARFAVVQLCAVSLYRGVQRSWRGRRGGARRHSLAPGDRVAASTPQARFAVADHTSLVRVPDQRVELELCPLRRWHRPL